MSEEKKPWPELEAVQNPVKQTDAERRELGRKNLVVGGALLAFVVLVFFVTMARMGSNFGG